MKAPCEEATIASGSTSQQCAKTAGPWILAATILASSMAFIDSTVVNIAVPTLQSSFHATVVDVQWVIESYGLLLSALILAGGALGDLFGRRRIFLSGIGLFAVASAACGLAPNINSLVAARCFQGVGAALLVPASLAIISASFDEKSRGQAIGTWSGFTAITMAFGPVLGGWLIEHGSWRWAFFLNLPLAVAVVLISLWRVPESRGTKVRHIDWLGALLATVGLGGIVTGFVEVPRGGWGRPLVIGSLTAGLIFLVLFVIVEKRAASPMVSGSLFKSRGFTGANLITLFLYAALGVFFFVFPMDLIQVRGYSTTVAGAAVLPMILSVFLLSRWSGGLVARYGARAPLTVGPLIVAAGFLIFALLPAGWSYWASFFPASLMLGLGMAVTVAPVTTVVMNSADQDHVGAASGINNAVARVAGVLAIAVIGIVLVKAFGSSLEHGLARLSLPENVANAIRGKEIDLAGLEVPRGLDQKTTKAIQSAVAAAFTSGFRLVMVFCAALAALSSLVAWRVIGGIAPSGRGPGPSGSRRGSQSRD